MREPGMHNAHECMKIECHLKPMAVRIVATFDLNKRVVVVLEFRNLPLAKIRMMLPTTL